MQFLDSIRDVKNNYSKYDEWEQKQEDDVAKRRYLSKILDLPKDKVKLTQEKAKAVFRASDILDKHSEDNCADMEQANAYMFTGLMMPLALAMGFSQLIYEGITKKPMGVKKQVYFQVGMILPLIVIGGAFQIWSSGKQKEASRIGRFQAKQNELKDIKNFVNYTPEQIEAAKIIAKKIPDKKDDKNFIKIIANMKQMSKDKIAYEQWLKKNGASNDEIEKILNTDFNSEQLAKGEEDKEIIVNIVKDVNMQAENYSENVENVFDTISMLSFLTDIPIFVGIDKILNKFKVSSNKISATKWIACALYPLAILSWATMKKKEASRVGRFSKQQEILDNPELIMAYSNDQLKMAENIKAPSVKKGFFASIKDNLIFFKKYLKDSKGYAKYKETTAKENEKLYEALNKSEISDKQLKDAQNLQTKTFRTFDKMDEMSQRYSEDMEAATEIGKNVINNLFSTLMIATPFALGFGLKKGWVPIRGIAKSFSKLAFEKNSSIRTFIEHSLNEIKNDKELNSAFSKITFDKTARDQILSNPKLKNIFNDFKKSNNQYFEELSESISKKDIATIVKITKSLMNENYKKNKISKWGRNLVQDCIKFYSVKKSNLKPYKDLSPMETIKKVYNDYKTLNKTILYGGFIPLTVLCCGIPFAITSWMTNLQLKAGKIGLMKAMDEIDNPKLFVDETK